MIQLKTILKVADNSGAKTVECIQVFKRGFTGYLGDEIVCVVKEMKPPGSTDVSTKVNQLDPVLRRQVRHAVVIRTKCNTRLPDGRLVKFDENACVLINDKKEPLGTRVFGGVLGNLKKKWPAITNISQNLIL